MLRNNWDRIPDQHGDVFCSDLILEASANERMPHRVRPERKGGPVLVIQP
jgi:hypothetical protein